MATSEAPSPVDPALMFLMSSTTVGGNESPRPAPARNLRTMRTSNEGDAALTSAATEVTRPPITSSFFAPVLNASNPPGSSSRP